MADNTSGERANKIMANAAAGLRAEAQAYRDRADWLDREAARLATQADEQFSPEAHAVEDGIAQAFREGMA